MAGVLTAAIAAAFAGGVTADPYYEYTTLLLPGNGTNGAQNNTFLDGSTNNFTITRNGNTTQGTFSPFSQTGWGNYFDGNGDYLSLANNAAFDFGSGDFTIDCWFYLTGDASANNDGIRPANVLSTFPNSAALSTDYSLTIAGNTTTTGTAINFNRRASGTSTTLTYTATITKNVWHYICVVRSGSTLTMYYDGSQVAQNTSFTGNVDTGGNPFKIGGTAWFPGGLNYGQYFPGYISGLKVVKGVANTPSGVPTSPPTQSTGTSLLTCQYNRFIDNSTNNFTLTVNGNTSVVAFSPFNPTASWSATTYGGSGYFDGSGDYLSVAGNAAFAIATSTTPFTIEGWIYPTAAGGVLFAEQFTGAGNSIAIAITMSDGIDIFTTTGRTIAFGYYNGSNWTIAAMANTTVPLNAYSHVACVFTGSTTKIYINGSDVTKTSSPTPATTWGVTGVNGDGWFVGKRWDSTATECFTGYIGGFRFVNGTAVYTGAFTPPTAPLTAITNTSLLLNFTNAGIYDATSKNDLETVGNAQISTAISAKWGSGSMYFDGTGDYLYKPYDSFLNQLNGNFTIEAWIYPTVTNTEMIIAGSLSSGGSGNWFLEVTSANKLLFEWVSSTPTVFDATSTISISPNTWTYVAAVKNGGTITLYINGTASGTSSPTGTYRNLSAGFAIGRGGDYNALYFTGYIQDLRMSYYARTITASPTAAFPTL